MRLPDNFPAKSTSCLIGVLSLGAETLWVRVFSFVGRSTPKAVSIILGTYLLGIALGAVLGARLCRTQHDKTLVESLTLSLLIGSAVILASPFVLVAVQRATAGDDFYSVIWQAAAVLCLAFLPAFIFSICFPICHQLGTTAAAGQIGRRMSRVYASNIAGSVAGPLLVNFAILQFATTQLAFAILGMLGVAAGTVLMSFATARGSLRMVCAACCVIGIASLLASAHPENWFINSLADPGNISRVVETRQGIVVAYKDERSGDQIYGGNVYDGTANLDARLNSNGINRILVTAAFRPNPRRVLELGLSIGSWNYIITGIPGVEQIDVVEINPGYLSLMTEYPRQLKAANDPRVRMHIGDGRKFLRDAPPGFYDLVVMNTTYYWRAYSSLLLSKEFLTLVRSRMAPGGLLTFNTTGSTDALYTAASVFPHAYLYDNFAICSDYDWRLALDKPESVRELLKVSPETSPMLSSDDDGVAIARRFLARQRTAGVDELAAKVGRPLEIITDRNLITEYKYGRIIGFQ